MPYFTKLSLLLCTELVSCTPRQSENNLQSTYPGVAPDYTQKKVSDFQNSDAVINKYWAPGLNEGFVPQGLSFISDKLVVAGYFAEPEKTGCRIYLLDSTNAKTILSQDLPPDCKHAGGIAVSSDNTIVVADTHYLFIYKYQLEKTKLQLLKSIHLAGQLKGSFAAWHNKALWIGTYEKENGALFKIEEQTLLQKKDGDTLSDTEGIKVQDILPLSQGMAFSEQNELWLSTSNSKFGKLARCSLKGTCSTYAFVAGIEDLEFSPSGHLWGVSEAGTKPYTQWKTFAPMLFKIDTKKLIAD